jgi:hypothetical protein
MSEQTRQITHDQEPEGAQGLSSDKPGVDPGGYPEEPRLPDERPEHPEDVQRADDDTAKE